MNNLRFGILMNTLRSNIAAMPLIQAHFSGFCVLGLKERLAENE